MRRTPYPLLFNPEPTTHMAQHWQHVLGQTMEYEIAPLNVMAFIERVRHKRTRLYWYNGGPTPNRPDDWDVKRWQELTSTPDKLSTVLKYGNYNLINELQLSYYKIMYSIFFDFDSPHHHDLLLQGPLMLLAKELGYIEVRSDTYNMKGKRPAWQLPWCDVNGRTPFVAHSPRGYETLSRDWGERAAKLRQAHGLIAMGEHSLKSGGIKTLRRPCFLRINHKFQVEEVGFYEYANIRQDRLMQTIGSDYVEKLDKGPLD